MSITVHHGQMQDWLAAYDGPLFDSCVTDPPYHLTSIVKRYSKTSIDADGTNERRAKAGADGMARLSRGFMGKEWDGGDVAFRPETWRAVFDKLKPGAHLVAFSGTRTFHRMVCAIEDAGFEIRDTICWHYGSGFPKSHNVSKGIDKAAGAEREVIAAGKPVKRIIPGADQAKTGWVKDNGREYVPTETAPATDEAAEWEGWGTALKPATELICLARKPLSEKSVAANVLRWGTGAINIDGCRIAVSDADARDVGREINRNVRASDGWGMNADARQAGVTVVRPEGRWPANLIHDGSDEAIEGFPSEAGAFAPVRKRGADKFRNTYGAFGGNIDEQGSTFQGDSGSAARFFYSAKAGPLDRLGSTHATIKPVDLMRWLCRLVTPPGGHILEPFAGSGTTGIAAMAEQMSCTMIEMEADHVADIERKLSILRGTSAGLIEQHLNARRTEPVETLGGLFADPELGGI